MKKNYIIFLFAMIANIQLYSQSAGPSVPTTFATTGAGASWANLSGIAAIDNNPAYVDLAQFPTCNSFMCYYSNYASFTGFGFSIPVTAVITGIQLDILQRVSSPGGGIHDSILILAVAGQTQGIDYANDSNWFDTPTMRTYGGPTDTWGYAWTPGEINDPGFGFYYALTNSSYDQPGSVDYLAMTVFYQDANGISSHSLEKFNAGFSNGILNLNKIPADLNNFDVEVTNMTGQIIYAKHFADYNSNSVEVDASAWKDGIYFVRLETETLSISRKVILSN